MRLKRDGAPQRIRHRVLRLSPKLQKELSKAAERCNNKWRSSNILMRISSRHQEIRK